MSCIFGIARFDGRAVRRKEVEKMQPVGLQRKVDAEGVLVDTTIGFGHEMLWTTPESLHEKQPLVGGNGNHVLVSDARLDNRRELIEDLEIEAGRHAVLTDPDLILLSYQRWGVHFMSHLTGDFALAIWDKDKSRLIISRDRFGIRPLYFTFINDVLYFSSYLDCLPQIQDPSCSINYKSVKSFSHFSTIGFEETMYEGVYRVPPSYMFVFSKNSLSRERYWFPEKIKINRDISLDDAARKVRELLSEAVESRLRIYGNWGCELSGGLDSSAVALIANELAVEPLKTFSMRYQSYSCDEWEFTEEVIEQLESDPVCLDVDSPDFQKRYPITMLPKLSPHWPAYGSFMQNYGLGEMMAGEGVRVCLTGHGGDHIFTGTYNFLSDYLKTMQWKRLVQEYSCFPSPVLNALHDTVRLLLPQNVKGWIKSILSGGRKSDLSHAENFEEYWGMEGLHSAIVFANINAVMGRHHVMHTDNNHYRALERNDNIEFRHPFFDTKLVEFVLSLPNYYKYSYGSIKVVLREALKDIYPEKIYRRDDKAEFSEGLLAQMNSVDMQNFWQESVLLRKNLVEETLVSGLLEKYQLTAIGPADVGTLWRLTNLELWIRNKIRNKIVDK